MIFGFGLRGDDVIELLLLSKVIEAQLDAVIVWVLVSVAEVLKYA